MTSDKPLYVLVQILIDIAQDILNYIAELEGEDNPLIQVNSHTLAFEYLDQIIGRIQKMEGEILDNYDLERHLSYFANSSPLHSKNRKPEASLALWILFIRLSKKRIEIHNFLSSIGGAQAGVWRPDSELDPPYKELAFTEQKMHQLGQLLWNWAKLLR